MSEGWLFPNGFFFIWSTDGKYYMGKDLFPKVEENKKVYIDLST